jgi:hypothetical protein
MALSNLTSFPLPEWGPWIGVPPERQSLCAVEGCLTPGKPQGPCPTDGNPGHHHGCVHYERGLVDTGLTFRKGWGWLCDEHYAVVAEAAAKQGPRWSQRARA